MPRPKIYANNAEKCRARRRREKQERTALRTLTSLLAQSTAPGASPLPELIEELPEEQKQAVARVLERAQTADSLQKNAA